MARLSIPMSDVKHWSPCSEFNQDPGKHEQGKTGHGRKRRFALIALQTMNFHDLTADLSFRKLRVDAAADVQISA
jgi:hypothetical protein